MKHLPHWLQDLETMTGLQAPEALALRLSMTSAETLAKQAHVDPNTVYNWATRLGVVSTWTVDPSRRSWFPKE